TSRSRRAQVISGPSAPSAPSALCYLCALLPLQSNGQGEIRTLDTLAGMPVFETGAFNHSATCPGVMKPKCVASPIKVSAGNRAIETVRGTRLIAANGARRIELNQNDGLQRIRSAAMHTRL